MTDRFTNAEARFVLDTLNAGPEAMPVSSAPTDRVRDFLTASWGLQGACDCEPADGEACDEFCASVDCGAEGPEGPCFKTGFERTRHALGQMDCWTDAMGWTMGEVEAMVEAAYST
jgi:hypothetical protein